MVFTLVLTGHFCLLKAGLVGTAALAVCLLCFIFLPVFRFYFSKNPREVNKLEEKTTCSETYKFKKTQGKETEIQTVFYKEQYARICQVPGLPKTIVTRQRTSYLVPSNRISNDRSDM